MDKESESALPLLAMAEDRDAPATAGKECAWLVQLQKRTLSSER